MIKITVSFNVSFLAHALIVLLPFVKNCPEAFHTDMVHGKRSVEVQWIKYKPFAEENIRDEHKEPKTEIKKEQVIESRAAQENIPLYERPELPEPDKETKTSEETMPDSNNLSTDQSAADKYQGAIALQIASLLVNKPPLYPLSAKKRGWEGTVILSARITAAGRIEKLTVVKSSGYFVLDNAAATAAKKWEFTNVAGTIEVEIPVVFVLRD